MKIQNKSRSRFIKFLNGKAFYGVLCVCLIAIGVAAWSGVEGYKRLNGQDDGNNSLTAQNESKHATVIPSKPSATSDQTSNTDYDKNDSSLSQTVTQSQPEPETEQTAAPVATYFVSPVLGEVIKGYSATELQYSMTMNDMRLHKGIDIAADAGTPVVAAGEGLVIAVFKDAMLGTVVEIDHGNGIIVRYCGLNATPAVKQGDTVDSSTRLGSVDTIPSESVEQRHLHLEFYKDNKSVSPTDYISQ